MIKDIKKVIELIKQRLSIAYKTRNHYLKDNIKSEKWESIIIILEGLYKEITGEEFAISELSEVKNGNA